MMKKAQLTLDDVTESGFKILSVLMDRMMVSQIALKTGISNTTIRRLLQRLEVFGLVEDIVIDQAKHFTLTRNGRTFVKRISKTKANPGQRKEPVLEENPIVPDVEVKPTEHRESFDLSVWLRQKAQGFRLLADEFNAMADDLSVYEE